MAPWSDFWGDGGRAALAGDAYRGTPVVVKMENPNWSISEIDGDDDEFLAGGRRRKGKTAKQITWVLLFKAHSATGCLAWLASAAVALGGTVRRLGAARRTDSNAVDGEGEGEEAFALRSQFYAFIQAFLLLSLFLLVVELAAYTNGWGHLAVSVDSLCASWVRFHGIHTRAGASPRVSSGHWAGASPPCASRCASRWPPRSGRRYFGREEKGRRRTRGKSVLE